MSGFNFNQTNFNFAPQTQQWNSTGNNLQQQLKMEMNTSKLNPYLHYSLPFPPNDSVSELDWKKYDEIDSRNATLIAASSWDSSIRIWKVSENLDKPKFINEKKKPRRRRYPGDHFSSDEDDINEKTGEFNSSLIARTYHSAPALCVSFTKNGNKVLSGGCDNKIKILKLGGSNLNKLATVNTIGTHDAPVKIVKEIVEKELIFSGGWDEEIKIWDLRSSTVLKPVMEKKISGKIVCGDVKSNIMLVGIQRESKIKDYQNFPSLHMFDLRKIKKNDSFLNEDEDSVKSYGMSDFFEFFKSHEKYKSEFIYPSITCVKLFPTGKGFALCGLGRIAVKYFEDPIFNNFQDDVYNGNKKRSFLFKCHRESNIGSNNRQKNSVEIFSTVGSNGRFHFWNKAEKRRVFQGKKRISCPITAGKFCGDSSFVYSVGYDFSQGSETQIVKSNFGSEIYIMHTNTNLLR